MYHPIKVHHLSDNLKSKLLRGQPVRIQKGNHHTIHLSEQQHKKLHKAHLKGQKSTILFDPHQTQQHASGLMGDLYKKAKHLYETHKEHSLVKPIVRHAKRIVHRGISNLHHKASEYLPSELVSPYANELHNYVGEGIRKHSMRPLTVGLKHSMKKHSMRPRMNVGFKHSMKKHSMKKHSMKGKGIFSKVASIAGTRYGPIGSIIGEHAGQLIDNKLGTGLRKLSKHPKFLHNNGGSLMPAGY